MTQDNMLEQVMEIVRRASALMVTEGFSVEQKDGLTNIVTSSDLAVQHFLCRELSALLPGCGFLCEEEDLTDTGKEYVWIIDPIDGTANYARNLPDCCISVALKHGSEVILGVVFSPGRGEMYCAEKGRGAWCNGKPIRTSRRPFADAIMLVALSAYNKNFAHVCSDIILEAYAQGNDVRRFGSAAIELCLVAAGKCDIHFEIRLQPWDYAAGMLILTEAGGTVSSLDGTSPRLDAPDLVCAGNNMDNQRRFLHIIRKYLPEIPYQQ